MHELTPIDIVQRQLDAYNARDIEAFVELFADDAATFDLGATTPSLVGKEQIRLRYATLFEKSPTLHSHLIHRTVFGHVVIDVEQITGREGSVGVFEILAIYEVRESKIQRAHFARK